MTLADMVNLAGGVQQYQQAQQLNPVQLEAARTNLSRLQQLTPLEVRGKTAETLASEGMLQPRITEATEKATQAGLQTQGAQMDLLNKQANLIHSGTVAMINDPDVIAAEKDPQNANIPKLVAKLNKFGMMQGQNAGISMDKVGEINSPTIQIASNDPGALRNHLKTLLYSELDAHAKAANILPTEATVNNMPMVRNPTTGEMEPATITGKISQPAGVTANMMNKDVMSQPTPIRFQPPSKPHAESAAEAAERANGTAYATNLINGATNLSQTKRTLQDVIQSATGLNAGNWFTTSLPGSIVMQTLDKIKGDPTYLELQKNLARAQIEAITAKGGSMDTVAGQNLQKAANGDVRYPPQALIDIAQRNFADIKDAELQAQAIQKFHSQFGEANTKSFQSDWAKNSDNKIFQAMAINEQIQDPAQKKKAIDALLGNDPKQRQLFYKKYSNIQKMVRDGTLQ
jgi:hypothetical protein